jgi:hypothetical protein
MHIQVPLVRRSGLDRRTLAAHASNIQAVEAGGRRLHEDAVEILPAALIRKYGQVRYLNCAAIVSDSSVIAG